MTAPLLLIMALAFTIANAAAQQPATDAGATVATSPDAELLEFIAAFDNVDGTWMDPMQFYDTFVAGGVAQEDDHE